MSEYTPRLTDPSNDDLRWIRTTSGGYNQCIYGYYGAPSVLPNCTGYVHGRVMEIRGVNTDDAGLSFGDGAQYYGESTANWTRSQTPALGAVACWGNGNGHVAIVEQIIDNDTIVLSESSWSGPPVRFRTVYGYRSRSWRPVIDTLTFQGFLLNPYIDDEPEPPTPPGPGETGSGAVKLLLLYKGVKNRRSKNARVKRSSILL